MLKYKVCVPETTFYWKVTSSNKETRILTDVFWIKKHFVFRYPYDKKEHPEGYKDGSDYDLFMRQITSYVKGKKDQHDDALPDSPEANIAVCDTADTGSDYLSCPMAKKCGHLYYIYDVVFTQLSMDFSAPILEGALKENKVQVARFESNNGGKLMI